MREGNVSRRIFKFSAYDTPAISVATTTLSAKIVIEQSQVDLDLRFARTDLEGGPWARADVGGFAGPS